MQSNQVDLKQSRIPVLSGIIGNIIEHYDTALYGFLAPFIAHLFFPTFHPVKRLILSYSVLLLDIVAKPLGALFFGRIGDRFGRTRALSLSITCTAICTGMMGFIPTYAQVGFMAPVILAMTRFSQKFFAAGECVGAVIFILEKHQGKHRNLLGSLYGSSTMIGILMASAFASCFELLGIMQEYWRCLFFISFATALVGLFFRYRLLESEEFLESKLADEPIYQVIRNHWRPFLAIAAAAGFSYATYGVSFIFLNSYVPLISNVTASQMMVLNTGLITLDLLLLPLFGILADKFSPVRQMQLAAGIALITAVPLMALCENASYLTIVCIRMFWMMTGVAFCAPFHTWSQELVPVRLRYTLISLAYTFGSQFIGAPFISAGLWLYKVTEMAFAPGLYLSAVALFTLVALKSLKPKKSLFDSKQKLVFLSE